MTNCQKGGRIGSSVVVGSVQSVAFIALRLLRGVSIQRNVCTQLHGHGYVHVRGGHTLKLGLGVCFLLSLITDLLTPRNVALVVFTPPSPSQK